MSAKILWQPPENYAQDGTEHDTQTIDGAVLTDAVTRIDEVGEWRPLLASTRSPTFEVIPAELTTRELVEGLKPGVTTRGSQHVGEPTIMTPENAPVGVSFSLHQIHLPDNIVLEGWDLGGKTVVISGKNQTIRNCIWNEPSSPPAAAHYPLLFEATAEDTLIEFNTMDGFNGFGGPAAFINMRSSGINAATSGPTNVTFRRNHFLNNMGDVGKIAGNNVVFEENYLAQPRSYPDGTEEYDDEHTYTAGEYALFGPYLYRSDVDGVLGVEPHPYLESNYNALSTYGLDRAVRSGGMTFVSKIAGNTGNTPPITAIDDEFWRYSPWQGFGPHADGLTVTSAVGGGVIIRRNYFNWTHEAPAIGLTQLVRAVRDAGSGLMYGPVDVYENVMEKPFGGYYPVSAGYVSSYNAGRTHVLGGLCHYGGVDYISLQSGNKGNQPDISPLWWQVATDIFAPGPVSIRDNWVAPGLNGAYYYPSDGVLDVWDNNRDVVTDALVPPPVLRP